LGSALGILTAAGTAVLKGGNRAGGFASLVSAIRAELEALQKDLSRIEKQLAGIQSDLKLLMEAPMRTALVQLDIANAAADPAKRERSLEAAQSEFVRAASLVPERILANEIPKHLPAIRARVYAGACCDLIDEPTAALVHYEGGFQRSLEIEGQLSTTHRPA